MVFQENEEKMENSLLNMKITVPKTKWKNKQISEEEILIKNEYENKNIDIIINHLGEIIDLNLNSMLIIKNKLDEKINTIIKEKKLRDLRDKINEIVRNFEFLINNEEFDYLECLINSNDFCESKLPENVIEKLNYYKEKKTNIENLFSLHNINVNEDYDNNNHNLLCQEYITININD